jgi:hypothetical protein
VDEGEQIDALGDLGTATEEIELGGSGSDSVLDVFAV